MADINPAFLEQILDIPKRQRKSHVHHHRHVDDLGAGSEVFEGGAFFHAGREGRRSVDLELRCSDTATKWAAFDHDDKLRPQVNRLKPVNLTPSFHRLRPVEPGHTPSARNPIQNPMSIIIRFSVNEMKPRGTFDSPPTQAHFSSRLSM